MTIGKYEIYEQSLSTSNIYSNPYIDVWVYAIFSGPTKSIQLDGFWDGGNNWKIRMAPTEVGTWTYTTYSNDAQLNGQTGNFDVVDIGKKGFVKVDPNHPHHFMWDDGTPFYYSPTSTMIAHFNLSDAGGGNRRVDDGTFQSLIDTRVFQGFTTIQWGFYGFNKPQFNDKTQANEGGPPFISYNPNLLNPSYYQFGDQRVKAVTDRGMVAQFTLGWPDQGILSSIGDAAMKRYWSYLIARYSAYNVEWNMFGEGDEFGSNYQQVLDDYGNLTRAKDPYKHLLTTHLTGGPSATLATRNYYDHVVLQLSTSQTSNYLSYNKPVINAEYGGYEDYQVNGEQLRPLMWNVRMRGGYPVYESWGNDINSTGSQYFSYMNHFFQNNTNYILLEYLPSIFNNTPGLANPENEYITYLQTGGSRTIDLSSVSGNINEKWYNPRTGIYQSTITIQGGSQTIFNAPDSNDWVLHIVKECPQPTCQIEVI